MKTFLEAYQYFLKNLGIGQEKLAKELAEEVTGIKATGKLTPAKKTNVTGEIISKTEKGELTTINSKLSNPLNSDFINSKMDGTSENRYSVIRAEIEKLESGLLDDLNYMIQNDKLAGPKQVDNFLYNRKLLKTLKDSNKKLETGFIADKKDPQMIYDAYKQSLFMDFFEKGTGKTIKGKPIKQTKEESLAEGREMFKGFEPKVIEGGKGVIPKDKMTKTMIDEGFADPKYFDPNALDISSNKPVTMNKAFFDNAREQAIKQINEQERLMVPKNHSNYKYLMASLRGNKDKLTALNITEELGGNIKMFDDLRMKNITDMNAAPLNKFEYLKNPSVDDGTKGIDDLFDKDGVLNKEAVLKDITDTLQSRIPKKAGQGKYTKAQVVIARLENTLKDALGKTDADSKYINKNFPGMIKEIKAKPELANDPNVFKELTGPLPKGQKFVEYDDGTMDFFQKTDFGPQNIAPAKKLAQELGISTSEASAILKMEPEDQVLEIGRRKALAKQVENLGDDTVEKPTSLYDENFDDYFDPDDKPNQAKGGIISLT